MKQIYGIALICLTLTWGCLARPTESELPNKAQTPTSEKEQTPAAKSAIVEAELILIPNIEANVVKDSEIPEVKKESEKSNSKDEINKIIEDKEEEVKFKDSPKDVALEEIQKQTELWKDFEDDFSLLADRMPDLTEEDYDELKKDGAMPWNFLKSLDATEGKKKTPDSKPQTLKSLTPIFITVPIVINSNSNLPISLSVGGQEIPLKLAGVGGSTKDSYVIPNTMKTSSSSSSSGMATPTSVFNKLMDYNDPPPRQTNRHRSNNRKKIYAHGNKQQQVGDLE